MPGICRRRRWPPYAAIVMFLFAGCGPTQWLEKPGVEVPPPRRIVSYYDEAILCLTQKIRELPDLPPLTVGVTDVPDESGKMHINGDQHAAGSFLPKNSIGAIIDPLMRLNAFTVLDQSDGMWKFHSRRLPLQKEGMMAQGKSWQLRHPDGTIIPVHAEMLREGEIDLPDIVIFAQLSGLDFGAGAALEATVYGVGGGIKRYDGQVSADGRMVEPRSGTILAESPMRKNIVGFDGKVDIGRFFGNVLVTFNAAAGKREALAQATRTVMDIIVIDLVHKFTGITACNHLTHGILPEYTYRGEPPYKQFLEKRNVLSRRRVIWPPPSSPQQSPPTPAPAAPPPPVGQTVPSVPPDDCGSRATAERLLREYPSHVILFVPTHCGKTAPAVMAALRDLAARYPFAEIIGIGGPGASTAQRLALAQNIGALLGTGRVRAATPGEIASFAITKEGAVVLLRKGGG